MSSDYVEWFRANVLGAEYTIAIGDPDVVKQIDEDSEGVCVPMMGVILLSSKLAPSRRGDVVMHELLHAIMHGSGLSRHLFAALGVEHEDDSEREAAEEMLVNALAPLLWDTLKRNGLIALPEGPR